MEEKFKYTKEELEKCSVFEVRVIGRRLGVKSPTSCRKNEIIDRILAIQEGDEKPQFNSNSRGRPPAKILGSQKGGEDYGEYLTKQSMKNLPEIKYGSEFKLSENHLLKDKYFDGEQIEQEPASENTVVREGIFDNQDKFGFLRSNNCENSANDTHVSGEIMRMYGLRRGDFVKGLARSSGEDRALSLISVTEINGENPEKARKRPHFDSLIPIYPNERIKMEIPGIKNDFSVRCVDLIAPIGKGQRAMIVSQPKTGKTTFLKKIANSISTNYPDIKLMVLLIDERPEEVTDMKRSIKGDVIFSTFDEMPEHHTRAADLTINSAKRYVEMGKDVVILLDSLTRLARAYNLTIPPTGRTLSGGIDPGALYSPKRFFGAARNIENGGSLTIIATALVDTGSRMDDVIFEEFKGTGNMEIHLDRKLSEKRIFPAIDLNKSGTRREELLLSQKELEGVWAMRKILASGDNAEATENLINMLVKTTDNQEFIEQITMHLEKLQKEGYSLRKNSGM